VYGAARQISARGSIPEPRKSGYGHVFTAIVWPCTWRRLPRAILSPPCRLYLLVSGFGPLIWWNHPPKSMSILVGF